MVDLQICTGPYILCHMLQLILDTPLLVYMGLRLSTWIKFHDFSFASFYCYVMLRCFDSGLTSCNILPLCAVHTKCFDSGLTMTYMAPSYAVEDILKSARSIASDFRWTDSSQGQGTIKGTSCFSKYWQCLFGMFVGISQITSLSPLLSQFEKILWLMSYPRIILMSNSIFRICRILPYGLRCSNPSHCNCRHGFDPCGSIPPCHGSMDRCSSSIVFVSNRTLNKNDQDIYSHQIHQLAMQTFTLPTNLTGEASKPRKSLEAIALRSELWRRYPMTVTVGVMLQICLWQGMGISGIRMYKVVLKFGFSMIFHDFVMPKAGWPLVLAFADYCGISQMPALWLQFGGKIYSKIFKYLAISVCLHLNSLERSKLLASASAFEWFQWCQRPSRRIFYPCDSWLHIHSYGFSSQLPPEQSLQ